MVSYHKYLKYLIVSFNLSELLCEVLGAGTGSAGPAMAGPIPAEAVT